MNFTPLKRSKSLLAALLFAATTLISAPLAAKTYNDEEKAAIKDVVTTITE